MDSGLGLIRWLNFLELCVRVREWTAWVEAVSPERFLLILYMTELITSARVSN